MIHLHIVGHPVVCAAAVAPFKAMCLAEHPSVDHYIIITHKSRDYAVVFVVTHEQAKYREAAPSGDQLTAAVPVAWACCCGCVRQLWCPLFVLHSTRISDPRPLMAGW
jgi:hypothetical protein